MFSPLALRSYALACLFFSVLGTFAPGAAQQLAGTAAVVIFAGLWLRRRSHGLGILGRPTRRNRRELRRSLRRGAAQ